MMHTAWFEMDLDFIGVSQIVTFKTRLCLPGRSRREGLVVIALATESEGPGPTCLTLDEAEIQGEMVDLTVAPKQRWQSSGRASTSSVAVMDLRQVQVGLET